MHSHVQGTAKSWNIAITEIDMSEYMVTSRKYTNTCSCSDWILPQPIIKCIVPVLSITQTV